MKTNKAHNAAIKARYNLPEVLTAREILALSMGAFANHSFTIIAGGWHMTSISEYGFQLRSGDNVKNIKFAESPEAMELKFMVAPEFDRTW